MVISASPRAFDRDVFVKTDFSYLVWALMVGQSLQKYFTAIRRPSESSSRTFFTRGHVGSAGGKDAILSYYSGTTIYRKHKENTKHKKQHKEATRYLSSFTRARLVLLCWMDELVSTSR